MSSSWWFDPTVTQSTTPEERDRLVDYLHTHQNRVHVTFLVKRTDQRIMAFTDAMSSWLIVPDTMSQPTTRIVRI